MGYVDMTQIYLRATVARDVSHWQVLLEYRCESKINILADLPDINNLKQQPLKTGKVK